MNRIKHFGSFLAFVFSFSFRVIKSRAFHIALALIVWTYLVAWFNSNYEIRTKFTFGIYERGAVKPIVPVASASAELLPPMTQVLEPLSEEQIVMLQPHGSVLWKVYQLETQRGKTDWCRLNNKGYGGFGVKFRNADGKSEIACYDSFQKAADRAEYWMIQNGIDKDLTNALCSWNQGPAMVDNKPSTYQNCSYYQSYLSL